MPATDQLADEIRAFLESTNQTRTAAAEELATQYAEACHDANRRLRQCADLLRRGLRGEAIHLAEIEPNLLDVVASLDMEEVASWRETCAAYDWTEPPALAMTAAAALNEAYAEEAPLQSLSAHLRIMALGRAPLNDRLVVMRKMAELDTANSFWDDDVKSFERARIDEIRGQISAGVRANDATAVGRLTEEIKSSAWRVSVPKDLQRLADDAHRRLCEAKADADLRQMVPALLGAYTEMSFDDCKSLLAKWLAISAEGKCSPAPDLQEQVDPVFAWFKEEEQRRAHKAQFDVACDALEQAIDTDQPTPELERAYQATLRFQHELPTELDDRYRGRLNARESAGKQRRRLIYTGIAAAFLAIAGTVVFLAYQSTLNHELANSIQVLHDAQNDVVAGNPKNAIELRKQLVAQHERIAQNPQMIKALADFDNAVAAENQREVDFSNHMQAAEAAGVQKPDDADLQQAEALAKTTAETQRIASFKDQLKEASDKQQQDNDAKFASDGRALTDAINTRLSDSSLSSDLQGYMNALKELTASVSELQQRQGLSPVLQRAQISSLQAQLSQRQQALDKWQTSSRLMDDVRHSGSNAAAHAAALKAYVDAIPDGPIADAFTKAGSMLDQEQAVEQWNVLHGPWRESPMPGSIDDAKARIAKIQDYLKSNPKTPLLNAANAYVAYLTQGIAWMADDGPWKQDFGKLLTNPLIHDLQYLVTVKGDRYYVVGQPQIKPSDLDGNTVGQKFQAVTSPDLDHPVTIPLQADNLLKDITPSQSPQSKFAIAAQNRIGSIDFKNWDTVGFDILDQLRKTPDIHPVLQAIILEHILDINKPLAEMIGASDYGKIAAQLATKDADDMAWMDPAKPVAQSIQNDLRQLVGSLPDAANARSALQAYRAQTINACNLNLLGEGVLIQSQDASQPSSWTVNSDTPIAAGEIAYIVSSDGLAPVAHAVNGKWEVDGVKLAFVPNGTLVFIAPSSVPTPPAG